MNVADGSIASFGRCRHVCFTPNYGRITATQRTDALGQMETCYVGGDRTFLYHFQRVPPGLAPVIVDNAAGAPMLSRLREMGSR